MCINATDHLPLYPAIYIKYRMLIREGEAFLNVRCCAGSGGFANRVVYKRGGSFCFASAKGYMAAGRFGPGMQRTFCAYFWQRFSMPVLLCSACIVSAFYEVRTGVRNRSECILLKERVVEWCWRTVKETALFTVTVLCCFWHCGMLYDLFTEKENSIAATCHYAEPDYWPREY